MLHFSGRDTIRKLRCVVVLSTIINLSAAMDIREMEVNVIVSFLSIDIGDACIIIL